MASKTETMHLEMVEVPGLVQLLALLKSSEIDQRQIMLPGIAYTRVGSYRHPEMFANPFLRVSPVNEAAFNIFERLRGFDSSYLGGITSIDAPWLTGGYATLICPATRTVPVEFPTHVNRRLVNIPIEFLPDKVPAIPDATDPEPQFRFSLDRDLVKRIPGGILIAQAGIHIYGHWLLDMVPRLTVLRRMMAMRRFSHMPIYHFGMPGYGRHILQLMGLENDRFVELTPNVLYETEELHEPAPVKIGHWVNIDQLAQALHSFRLTASAYADRLPVRDDPLLNSPPEKVYISRERLMPSDPRRHLANQQDMGILLGRLGFIPVYAEDYSDAEKTILLRNAKIIVGQDGSGLHNVVFSRNPCSVVSVSPEGQMNMWHGSFCSAMGHRVAFVQALAGEEPGHIVPLEELEATIRAVEDA